uniref:ATP-dependent DNA helicase II subunit 2 n=1 Tax=Blastobotrys adeninivorans TaxID=409370 RepID=A0A060TCM3_BLAAD
MGSPHGGRSNSDLQWMTEYVERVISDKVIAGRKTDQLLVIAARTDENREENGDKFVNVEDDDDEDATFSTFTLDKLRKVQSQLEPSTTDEGDLLVTMEKAIDAITGYTGTKKYKKNLVVLSNFTYRSNLPEDQEQQKVKELADTLIDNNIVLKVYGADFPDEEQAMDWPSDVDCINERKHNYELFKAMADRLNSSGTIQSRPDEDRAIFKTYDLVYTSLSIPSVRTVKPMRKYQGTLSFGDRRTISTHRAFDIPIEGFACTKKAVTPRAKKIVLEPDGTKRDVKDNRDYYVEGSEDPIDKADLVKGYLYGSEIVPFTEHDELVFKAPLDIEEDPGLQILGFVRNPPHWFEMSETDLIVAPSGNLSAAMALSSLSFAMSDSETCAIARFLKKKGDMVKVVLLSPFFDAGGIDCLAMCELPFAEDIRDYKFPSLLHPKTVTGKDVDPDSKQGKELIPTAEMDQVMGEYVDKMDLMNVYNSEKGESEEYFVLEESYNPTIHNINHAIRMCAINDDTDTLPDPVPAVTRFQRPPMAVTDDASKTFIKLEEVLGIKRVLTARELNEIRKQQTQEKRVKQDLDVDAILNKTEKDVQVKNEPQREESIEQKTKSEPVERPVTVEDFGIDEVTQVTEDNAIPDFKNMVQQGKVETACQQMSSVIKQLIEDNSAGDDRIIELVGTLREVCKDHGMDEWYANVYEDMTEDAPKRLIKKLNQLEDE